jgi:hypothetical protein
MRWAARSDSVRGEIVRALEAAGAMVHDLRVPVDLLVRHRGRLHLIELKSPGGDYTAAQRKFMDAWPVTTLRSVDDVEAWLCQTGS